MPSIYPSLFIIAALFSSGVGARTLTDAEKKGQALAAEAYAGSGQELFCECTFNQGMVEGACPLGAGAVIAGREISYVPVVTVAEYGRRRDCWTNKSGRLRTSSPLRGRNREESVAAPAPVFSCDVTDPVFRAMEADPFNLIPAVTQLAWARGHRKAAELAASEARFQGCSFDLPPDSAQGYTFEPPASSKGNIARVYLYFVDRYALPIEAERLATYKAWSQADPVDEQERRIHDALMAKTKTCNPYVLGKKQACW